MLLNVECECCTLPRKTNNMNTVPTVNVVVVKVSNNVGMLTVNVKKTFTFTPFTFKKK
jgi:hypothetical protein